MTCGWRVAHALTCLCLCLAGKPGAALAQLYGVVADEAGRGIVGAAVELWIDGSQDTTRTTAHGGFSFDVDLQRGHSAFLVIRTIGYRPTRHVVRSLTDTLRIAMMRIALPLPEVVVLARTRCPNTHNGHASGLWDQIRTKYASSTGWRAQSDAYAGRVPVSELGYESASEAYHRDQGCTEACRKDLSEKVKTKGYAWPWNGFKGIYDSWQYPPLESVLVSHFAGPYFAESHTFSAHARQDGMAGLEIAFCPRRTGLPGIEGSVLISSDSLIQEINWSFKTPSPDESAGGHVEFAPVVEIGKRPSLLPIRGLFWRRASGGYLQALMIYREWIACESRTCGQSNK